MFWNIKKPYTPWYLFILYRHSSLKSALFACDYEQPILFCRPSWETVLAIIQLKSRESIWRKKYVECTRMVEIRTRKMFLAVGKACTAIFGPTTGF